MNQWQKCSVLFACISAPLMTIAGVPKADQTEKPVRYVQTDPILGKQPHKQQYELRGGNLCPVDMFGSREHHKPCLAPGSK